MNRRTAIAVISAGLAAGATLSFGDEKPELPALSGKITSITGKKVVLEVEGDKPDWVKKGSGLKVAGGPGKIVDVTPTTVTFNCQKASTLKVGDAIEVKKGPAPPAGC